jgi:hypothetical protein
MAGTLLASELTEANKTRVHFAVATRADDVEIRRLLRENPMSGRISLSLEREPDYFADTQLPDETKQTIVAYEDGNLLCLGSCAVRERFVNGAPQRVGYLGGLRLDSSQAGRFHVVRRGYEFFRQLQSAMPADFYFTSIASDNDRALRFLERGLPGMPKYQFVGEFVTILLPTARRTRARTEQEINAANFDEFIDLLNESNRFYQFSPTWSNDGIAALNALGLGKHDFYYIRRAGQTIAGAALWDQRNHKQTVVRDYSPLLALVRPALNTASSLVHGPKFPTVGAQLRNAFVSHLVCGNEPDTLISVIAQLRDIAAQRELDLITMGFDANDPRLAIVRRHFRSYQYRSRLYVVHWPDLGGDACDLAGRILYPEVGLL